MSEELPVRDGGPHNNPVNTPPPPIIPAREGYDRWAATYDDDGNPLVATEQSIFDDLVGDVAGARLIDVGCGTGRHALALASRGARVTAVDFSRGMLDRARAKPGADRITWIEHDITSRLPFDDGSFDTVLTALVLDHIHDLDAFFAELARLAAPRGRIVATVMHPAMGLKGVQARFNDPATGEKIHVESARNSVTDYINAALRAGLAIDHLSEHTVTEALAARLPRARPYLDWPILLAMRFTKP